MTLENRSVCISGGTGSLGNALTKRLLSMEHGPSRVIILSRDELKQHEMRQRFDDPRLRFWLGDVRDKDRLYRAFDGVQVVLHTAALKQVPAAEANPFEFVATNVIGSMNVANAAIDRGVERVLAVSTDKAVSPQTGYGASKLMMERIFMAAGVYAGRHQTKFALGRYGNVTNSRGSVIPLWREQSKTGRITLTDKRMTRFWVQLDDAAKFVLDSLDRMTTGEVFVPRLPSVLMTDVAKAVAPDCEINTIGIRGSEKLHEALLGDYEQREEHDGYYVVGRGALGPAFTSDVNDKWLSVDEIRSELDESIQHRSAI